ncbi:hypothetical protein GGX14DRAFT_352528, partial [Mycena pura]
IEFVQGTLRGKYTDFKVFGGLVQKVDRIERGVGMQNFTCLGRDGTYPKHPQSAGGQSFEHRSFRYVRLVLMHA